MNRQDYNVLLLTEACEKVGVSLSDQQVDQFLIYYEYLVEKNKVMNLTAITEYEDVVLKHFADSLAVAQAIDLNQYQSLIDVGTGAGFPGLPLKIAFPHLKVVLMDSLNKRINFLNEVIDKIRCANIETVHSRAEDLAHRVEYRETFDLCISRAVANLSSLSEYCLPFLKKGGLFISYKSINIDDELNEANRALHVLGGELKEKKQFYLPDTDIGRTFLIIEKKKTTPKKYPRKAGLPSKEPL